jgi:uncharacterized protein (DUF1800 family)
MNLHTTTGAPKPPPRAPVLHPAYPAFYVQKPRDATIMRHFQAQNGCAMVNAGLACTWRVYPPPNALSQSDTRGGPTVPAMDVRTAQALVRFGLGRRGDEALPSDPDAWLSAQLHGPDPALIASAPSTLAGLTALREDRDRRRQIAADAAKANPTATGQPKEPPKQRLVYQADAAAELANALTTPAPFRERLVWFWTNHFTVSIRQGGCAALAGAFIEEAIRPHVTGRFTDLLLAVMRHPAMLLYLQNAESVGPNSPAGQRSHRGLNENLARECLELHTVSPAAGYSQADVTNFARILTGWSVDLRGDPPGFRFRPQAHEPGAFTLLGQSFPPGEEGGVAALTFLSGHPSTHRFLATKLVRQFVADQPPPDAVRRIEGVLRDTRGDLGAAAAALITLDAAWQPATKLRTPQDLVVATLRAIDPPTDALPNLVGTLGALGQPVWNAPAPNGWSDQAADWSGPEAMMRRIDWSYAVAGRFGQADAAAIADANLGPLLRPATLDAVRHAGSRRDALTLLLASPEFQRR